MVEMMFSHFSQVLLQFPMSFKLSCLNMISRISMGRSLIVVAIFESDNAFLDTRVERSEKNRHEFWPVSNIFTTIFR